MSDDPRYPIGRYAPPDTIDAVARGRWRHALEQAPGRLRDAVAGLDDGQLDTPYRDGGWTARQIVHHLADSHLHTYLRFKWALTEDKPAVAGYDQDRWAALPDSVRGPVAPALELFGGLHASWLALLSAMRPDDFERSYVNPGNGAERSLNWALGLYAWHGEHHTAQILALRARRGW
jgi:uncharacterized damage-inducible protein DinB